MPQENLGRIPVGTYVRWRSQAGGYLKEKTGKVLGYLEAGDDAYTRLLDILGTIPNASRIKFQRTSLVDRYLVEVPRNTKAGGFDYYTPHAGVIHRQNEDKRAVL